jgi:hypothetical protein
MALIGLRKQLIIPYFSHPFFTRSLMLWPIIFLALDAAIFYEVAGAFLEFYVIHFRFAARSTYFVCL